MMQEIATQPPPTKTRFQWICFVTAVAFGAAVLGLVYDLKRDVTTSMASARTAITEANQAVVTVNQQLPKILTEVKGGTETLSGLAEDVELIKSIAGIRSDEANRGVRSLANYADAIQKLLAQETREKGAIILIEEFFGSDLRKVETVEEFLIGLNKEMIAIVLPLAKSKQEILFRTCHSGPPRRKPFYIKFPDADPVRLDEFIKQHHSESAALPDYVAN